MVHIALDATEKHLNIAVKAKKHCFLPLYNLNLGFPHPAVQLLPHVATVARRQLGTAHPLISEAFAREPSLESVDFQVRGWRL